MTTFDKIAERTGADPDAGLTYSWSGECPKCGGRRMLSLVPHQDGTASVWCLGGHCSREDLVIGLRLSDYEWEPDAGSTMLSVAHGLTIEGADPNAFGARILSRSALARLPEPSPLIVDTLDRNTVALLAGYHGTGKSFVALDWAACVATGAPWMGRDVRPGRVLYIVGEGAQGIHNRLGAWEEARGEEIPDERFHVFPAGVQLANEKARDELLWHAEAERYDLIIFDTLARCAVGLDENSAKDMGVFVDAVDAVKRTTRGTVLLVHHTGKDKATVRGSSALEAAVDTVYTTEGDPRMMRLRRTKRKDGPMDDAHTLSLTPVGESCVVTSTAPDEITTADGRPAEAWRIFRTTFGDRVATKAEIVSALAEHDFTRATAYRMITTLAAHDALRNVGTANSPRLRADVEAAREAGYPSVSAPGKMLNVPAGEGLTGVLDRRP